jgi:flagellar basal body-associated protein FliL
MAPEQKPENEDEQFQPKGTVLAMVLFVVLIVALWGYVYLMMLSQGATTP